VTAEPLHKPKQETSFVIVEVVNGGGSLITKFKPNKQPLASVIK